MVIDLLGYSECFPDNNLVCRLTCPIAGGEVILAAGISATPSMADHGAGISPTANRFLGTGLGITSNPQDWVRRMDPGARWCYFLPCFELLETEYIIFFLNDLLHSKHNLYKNNVMIYINYHKVSCNKFIC